ncbi:hypothetical protein [Mesorhizobium sp.]|uniref:hypothetical protein n=1 Tax=Mesorhizobium sp. TaxID=1871066 RepID=UPI0012184863|nr:hypothetical protein [Mesorhizobium sp.]TIS94771.1 MAG: hypothetical protein E5W87_33335 [Mesorhizobium sp.]
MGIMHLDPEAKPELHSEAERLIARYDSPLETVKALMAYNCELETQIVALAHRNPGLVHVSYDDTPPTLG